MLNIVIPIAGKAQRFVDAGFTAPKPLIMIQDTHMIDRALNSIEHDGCRLIFIVRQDHINSFSIDKVLREKFGQDIVIIPVDHITRGTLCSCLLARDFIDNDDPVVIYTPDVCFGPSFNPHLDDSLHHDTDGLILTFKANSPAHSYAAIDSESGLVTQTAEKKVISEHAAVGIYYFKHGSDFVRYADYMVEDEITTNGEFYVCPIYNLLVNDGLKVRIESVQSMHVLGTPEDLTFFNQRVLPVFGDKPIALCADHSGLELKDRIKSHLDEIGIQYIDFGTYVDADCDHYDFLSPAIKHINDGICNFGMAFCRTGQGFNIAANKAEGIRSALIFDSYTAEYAIRHNAANFFCLPSKYVDDVSSIIFALRASSFEGGRHATRIQRIERDNNVFRA